MEDRCEYFKIFMNALDKALSEIERSHKMKIEDLESRLELALEKKKCLYNLIQNEEISEDRKRELAKMIDQRH